MILKMNRLIVESIKKVYGKTVAVDGLSFDCEEGETLAILGPTGAGKTTTLRCIAGLEELDEGKIYINDQNLNGINPEHRQVAMFFENYALYPHMTVRENIAFPLKAPTMKEKLTAEQIVEKTEDIARLLQIENLLDRKITQLSGGQKQRTALGRVLVRSPKVFLLDEPIAHLDAVLRHRMRGEMKRIFSQIQSIVVYVTHDYKEAFSIGDRIMIINKGKVVQEGKAEEIYGKMKNMFVAKLVGDPQINLITGTLSHQSNYYYSLRVNEKEELNFECMDNSISQWVGREVIIGIRPQDMIVLEDKSENTLRGKLLTAELMGSNYVITVELLNGHMFKIKSKESFNMLTGKTVYLKVDTGKIHLFDPQSEEAIYHGEGF